MFRQAPCHKHGERRNCDTLSTANRHSAYQFTEAGYRAHRLRSWLAGPSADMISEADRLADSTISTIGDVLALLRRVTEARRGGVSPQR